MASPAAPYAAVTAACRSTRQVAWEACVLPIATDGSADPIPIAASRAASAPSAAAVMPRANASRRVPSASKAPRAPVPEQISSGQVRNAASLRRTDNASREPAVRAAAPTSSGRAPDVASSAHIRSVRMARRVRAAVPISSGPAQNAVLARTTDVASPVHLAPVRGPTSNGRGRCAAY
jgi:hypothetical protein